MQNRDISLPAMQRNYRGDAVVTVPTSLKLCTLPNNGIPVIDCPAQSAASGIACNALVISAVLETP